MCDGAFLVATSLLADVGAEVCPRGLLSLWTTIEVDVLPLWGLLGFMAVGHACFALVCVLWLWFGPLMAEEKGL